MASALTNILRLGRAGLVLVEHGVRLAPKGAPIPLALRLARLVTLPLRLLRLPFTISRSGGDGAPLARALTRLGPSYIKLGQFLAARPDLIGRHLTDELASLRDQLPPFSMDEARRAIESSLGGSQSDHFAELEPPVAAASIAQVHPASVEEGGALKRVAVKILRPDVERRFAADIESFAYGARLIERFSPPTRRLRPVAVIETLKRSMDIELDLRLEGAAISEMADNIKGDPGFRVPAVDWRRTARRILTLEWIDGISIGDRARLEAAGHDLRQLGLTILQSFLRHAMRDGFFHADMHQGNMFVERDGTVVAVDFGIMGRLGPRERRFLAEILHGLIHRDYRRAAEVHFWAGYVPRTHSVETFAQALRAIGEPIHGRRADEIS
ncbi:MAG: ubiquinone biosynthesis protein UbiB, partial [Hyphomicrobiaceae bacterium]